MTIRGPWAIAIVSALVLSLIVSFFAAGALVATWRFQKGAPFGPPLAELRQRIPDEARPYFRQAFEENRPELRAAFEALRDARSELEEIIRSEEFDRADADAAFDRVQARSMELMTKLRGVLLSVIEELPDNVRQDIRLGGGPGFVDPMGLGPRPRNGDRPPPPRE